MFLLLNASHSSQEGKKKCQSKWTSYVNIIAFLGIKVFFCFRYSFFFKRRLNTCDYCLIWFNLSWGDWFDLSLWLIIWGLGWLTWFRFVIDCFWLGLEWLIDLIKVYVIDCFWLGWEWLIDLIWFEKWLHCFSILLGCGPFDANLFLGDYRVPSRP